MHSHIPTAVRTLSDKRSILAFQFQAFSNRYEFVFAVLALNVCGHFSIISLPSSYWAEDQSDAAMSELFSSCPSSPAPFFSASVRVLEGADDISVLVNGGRSAQAQ